MAAVAKKSDVQRFLLNGVSWKEYTQMLRAFAERPGVRLTYDRGTLEFMTLSLDHESISRFFSLLILALTLQLGLPLMTGGSTTFRRRRMDRGLEPDDCYWIANERIMRGKCKVDLKTDPPPDLAVEVDVSRSMLNRMHIYAALRVPEVWRYKNKNVTFHVLGADGDYTVVKESKAIPQVHAADVVRLLPLLGTMDENELFRRFQAWAKARLGRK